MEVPGHRGDNERALTFYTSFHQVGAEDIHGHSDTLGRSEHVRNEVFIPLEFFSHLLHGRGKGLDHYVLRLHTFIQGLVHQLGNTWLTFQTVIKTLVFSLHSPLNDVESYCFYELISFHLTSLLSKT